MTDEQKKFLAMKLKEWDKEALLDCYCSYDRRLFDLNDDDMEKRYLLKSEILRRMGGSER